MAVEKGYFKEAGVKVELIPGGREIHPIEHVKKGKADLGIAGSELLVHYARGARIVALAAFFQHSPHVLVVQPGSGITSPKDLKGKTVSLGDHRDMSAEIYAMLLGEGLKPQDYKSVPFHLKGFTQGKIDAFSAYLSNQPFLLKKRGIPYSIINPVSYGYDFYGDVLFGMEDYVNAHPDKIQAVLRAIKKGFLFAMNQPENAARIILNKYRDNMEQNHRLDFSHMMYEASVMRQLIRPEIAEIGHMNKERWNHILETYQNVGIISPSLHPDLGKFILDIRQQKRAQTSEAFEMIIIILAGALFLIVVFFVYTRHLSTHVELRTRDLETLNRRLKREIEQRKKIEIELNSARLHALEMSRLKSNFLANMSHEIRTPMNGIIGFANLIINLEEGEDYKTYAQKISDNANRLLKTISNILDISKLESNAHNKPRVSIELVQETRTILSLLEPLALKNNVKMDLTAKEDRITCVTDPDSYLRIINNLIGNALKFTHQGEVNVILAKEARDNSDFAVIRIQDSGIGIDSEFLPKIFDEFAQESEGLSRNYEGSGLGLTITRNLVHMLGGTIDVSSEKGKGSVFTLRLPLSSGSVSEPSPTRDDDATESSFSTHLTAPQARRHGLVIDNDKEFRSSNLALFSKHLQVKLVSSPEEALSHLNDSVYHYIFTRPQFAGSMNAKTFIDSVRNFKQYKKTPIIVLASDHEDTDERFDNKIGYPVDEDELTALLDQLDSTEKSPA